MAEGEKTRLIAWSTELRTVHDRLRKALSIALDSAAAGEPAIAAGDDLLLFCHGFCVALTGHHDGEDQKLFPAIEAAHPELRETLGRLQQDHAMIAQLVLHMQSATTSAATTEELTLALGGIAAIMESHFRYEERELLVVLDTLALDADPQDVLGPL